MREVPNVTRTGGKQCLREIKYEYVWKSTTTKKYLEIKEKSTHPQTYAHLYTGRQTDPD